MNEKEADTMGKYSTRNFFAILVVTALAVVAATGAASASYASSAAGTGTKPMVKTITTLYNSTISPLPSSQVSQPFSGPQVAEFGNEINLARSSKRLGTVTVTMDSWACESGSWGNSDCVTTPGTSYSVPITFTIYNPGPVTGTAGTVIATKTQTFNIPFRPSASSKCSNGEWLDASDTCHNGLATNITFDFSSPKVVLPGTIVYGISYTTDNNGVDGNVDSLNVALSSSGTNVTAGSDTFPGFVFVSAGQPNLVVCPLPDGSFPAAGDFQADFIWCSNGYGQPNPLGTSDIPAVEFNKV